MHVSRKCNQSQKSFAPQQRTNTQSLRPQSTQEEAKCAAHLSICEFVRCDETQSPCIKLCGRNPQPAQVPSQQPCGEALPKRHQRVPCPGSELLQHAVASAFVGFSNRENSQCKLAALLYCCDTACVTKKLQIFFAFFFLRPLIGERLR
jgi:hypothetical protein